MISRAIYTNLLVAAFVFCSLRITAPITIYGVSFLLPFTILFFAFVFTRTFDLKNFLLPLLVVLILITNYFIHSGIWEVYLHGEMYLFIIANILLYGLVFSITDKCVIWWAILKSTTILILINSSAIVLQVILYYVLNYDLDFGILLGGDPSRNVLFGLYRPTGFYAEPSIYAGYMCVFLALRYAVNSKADLIFNIGLFSILLTFSTFSQLAFVVVGSIVYFKFTIRNVVALLMLGFVFFYYAFDSLIDRFERLTQGDDTSNNLKVGILRYWYENDLYFSGYGIVKKSLFYGELDALGDLTYYINVFMSFGVFSGLVLFSIIVFSIVASNLSMRSKALIAFSIVKFSAFPHPFFWVLFFFISTLHKSKTLCLK